MESSAVINPQQPLYCFTHLFDPNISSLSSLCLNFGSVLCKYVSLLRLVEGVITRWNPSDLFSLCHIAIFKKKEKKRGAQSVFFTATRATQQQLRASSRCVVPHDVLVYIPVLSCFAKNKLKVKIKAGAH